METNKESVSSKQMVVCTEPRRALGIAELLICEEPSKCHTQRWWVLLFMVCHCCLVGRQGGFWVCKENKNKRKVQAGEVLKARFFLTKNCVCCPF